MRVPAIRVRPIPELQVGDKVSLAGTKRSWTVQGVTKGGRFAILTQPFNPKRTVLYTVIDFDRGVRGVDDHYGMGYETPEQITSSLHALQHTEDATFACEDGFCFGGAEVSHRSGNHLRLDITAIRGELVDLLKEAS